MKLFEHSMKPLNDSELGLDESKELAEARATIKHELALDSDNLEEVKQKLDQLVDSPSFLEKIRNSQFLRRAFKIMILTFTLIKADPILASGAEDHFKKDKITQIDDNRAEHNLKLLSKNEYVVPSDVMIAFSETVDPSLMGVPAGGFFKKDFLAVNNRKEIFQNKLTELGYSSEQINHFTNLFKDGNLVFNEKDLATVEFSAVLSHERLHREIHNLPEEKKKLLNEARDDVIQDYLSKEERWSAKQDGIYLLVKTGEISEEEHIKLSKAEISKENPILLDQFGGTDGLIPILRNHEEFYTYLAMDKLSPVVKDYLIIKHPQAYETYLNLKEGIDLQISEQSLAK